MIAILLLSAASAFAAPAATGFDVYADRGVLHRLEGRGGGDGPPALLYARSGDGGKTWSEGVRVDAGRRAAYRFAEGDAQVAADGDALLAVWTATGTGPYNAGPLVAARSEDGGKTWLSAAPPDGGTDDHGRRFAEIAAAGGVFHAVWLDREGKSWVRAARSEDGGRTWSAPASLDRDACECCWNALAASGKRVWILYRGKNPRDMAVAASSDGGARWGKPRAVSPFGWSFNGCPHVGGALAPSADGRVVHALVWTGREDKMGLYVARSRDAGESWDPPARLGGSGARHADLARSGTRLAAVWDEAGAIWAATSADGVAWSAPRRLSPAKAEAAAPRVAAAGGGGFRAFWLEKGAKAGPARLADAPL